MIHMATVVEDLKLLTDDEITKIQLAVNSEWGARLATKKLNDRLTHSLVEAQSAGITDTEVQEAFANARAKAHKGRVDPAASPVTPPDQGLGTPINGRSPEVIKKEVK